MKQTNSPYLLLVAGLPGVGKSTVARAFVHRFGGVSANTDLLRKTMNLSGHYKLQDKEQVYQALAEKVRAALKNGQPVVVDSTFIHRRTRTSFEALARECGVPFYWVEIHAAEPCIRERLKTPRSDSEADFAVFLKLRAQNEPIEAPHLELWSDKMPLEDMVQSINHYMHTPQ